MARIYQEWGLARASQDERHWVMRRGQEMEMHGSHSQERYQQWLSHGPLKKKGNVEEQRLHGDEPSQVIMWWKTWNEVRVVARDRAEWPGESVWRPYVPLGTLTGNIQFSCACCPLSENRGLWTASSESPRTVRQGMRYFGIHRAGGNWTANIQWKKNCADLDPTGKRWEEERWEGIHSTCDPHYLELG